MTRGVYRSLVRCHPPAFRRRFGGEMLSVFDEAGAEHGFALVSDGLLSLARQWLLRTNSWKILIALCGGIVQVFGFGLPFKAHQLWAENHEVLTLSMQQMMLFTLGLLCTLFIVITWITFWNARFQRRRITGRKSFFAGVASFRRNT